MKLLRFGPFGAKKPGLLDADRQIRDLSGVIDDEVKRSRFSINDAR